MMHAFPPAGGATGGGRPRSAPTSVAPSKRRVRVLLRWVCSLGLCERVPRLTADFCDGVLLCRLIQHFAKDIKMVGLNMRPLSGRAAAKNVEEALNALRRKSGKTVRRRATTPRGHWRPLLAVPYPFRAPSSDPPHV